MSFTEWDLSEYEDPSLYDRENQGCPELPCFSHGFKNKNPVQFLI